MSEKSISSTAEFIVMSEKKDDGKKVEDAIVPKPADIGIVVHGK